MRTSPQTSNGTAALRRTAARSAAQLKAARDTATHGLKDYASASADQAVKMVNTKISDASNLGQALYNSAASTANGSLVSFEKLVARNPIGAVLTAATCGLVLGLFARR